MDHISADVTHDSSDLEIETNTTTPRNWTIVIAMLTSLLSVVGAITGISVIFVHSSEMSFFQEFGIETLVVINLVLTVLPFKFGTKPRIVMFILAVLISWFWWANYLEAWLLQ